MTTNNITNAPGFAVICEDLENNEVEILAVTESNELALTILWDEVQGILLECSTAIAEDTDVFEVKASTPFQGRNVIVEQFSYSVHQTRIAREV